MAPTTNIRTELRQRIQAARALPSPPIVTARLIELGGDPNTGINDIIEILRTDAALVARLLRLANSPLYARRRRTDNLRQAVMLLGVDAVLTASLSLTLLNNRSGSSATPTASLHKRCWTRSVHAAACAQTLAERVKDANPTEAFLASLLQDIGVQVVVRLEPTAYESIGADGTHDDLIQAEIEHLGADHALIGSELIEAWHLPDRIVDAVRSSHDLGGPQATTLSTLVTISGLVADGIGGDAEALGRAADAASTLLDMQQSTFGEALEHLVATLPDLALILDAQAPDPDVLAEMAHDVIVARHMKTQSATAELHDQLATLTTVAEELKAENRLDPLTGLSNRRDLDDVLDREFRLAKDHGFPLSVLFIDLDDFKKINDRYGHMVGDELLIQTARRISACVRDGDLVGRFGGEEFVVVLPGTDAASSCAAARRLIERFNSRPFDLGAELSITQTASIGVATLDEHVAHGDVTALVRAADIALYTAKHSGKNQWRQANDIDAAMADLVEMDLPATSGATISQLN